MQSALKTSRGIASSVIDTPVFLSVSWGRSASGRVKFNLSFTSEGAFYRRLSRKKSPAWRELDMSMRSVFVSCSEGDPPPCLGH